VEHDAGEIFSSQAGVVAEVLATAKVSPGDLAAIGITNQRETTVLWDRATLEPVHRAIVWQDRRTAARIDALVASGFGDEVQRRTGLVPDAYFSASKLAWLLNNVDGARKRAEAGELAFGTVDSWLLARLTEGGVHATDVSNASRTMLFNIHELAWDDDILTEFAIPRSVLPEVVPTAGIIAEARVPALAGVPIAAMAGDQHAATFGQTCFEIGQAKNTYGTGCFMMLNTGDRPTVSSHRLLTTVAWQRGKTTTYALEGSVFIAGAVVQWLRDGLGLIESSEEVEALAAQVPDSGGVVLVPAFAGLGAPHWDAYARGTIVGITRGTTRAHLARAALEAIAFQSVEVARAMELDSGAALKEMRVDGGAAGNDLLMQIQADLLGVPVVRPKITETTALGAAYLAGLAVGFWDDTAQLSAMWQVDRVFEPTGTDAAERMLGWERALERARGWEQP
jgi:glycerol kinase